MRTLIGFVLAVAMASSALAQSRPSTLSMSCAQARSLVQSRDAIVLSTGGRTYDRFVSGIHACAHAQYLEDRYVPTADNPQCPIGYVCTSNRPFWLDD